MTFTKTLVAVLATIAAGGVFAQEATPDTWITEAKSVVSRQAVDAQARMARASGELGVGEAAGHDFSSRAASKLTRVQVAAEAREAQRLGLTQAGEVQTFATASQLERIRRAGEAAIGTNLASR